MNDSGFVFKEWERRIPYYALMKMEEEKICALELLEVTFGGGWSAVIKEARKQSLKYGGRKALGCICGYFPTNYKIY